MNSRKPWWTSVTIIGALVLTVSMLVQSFLPGTITPEEMQELTNALTDAGLAVEEITRLNDAAGDVVADESKIANGLLAIGKVSGILMVLYGRFKAQKQVTLLP